MTFRGKREELEFKLLKQDRHRTSQVPVDQRKRSEYYLLLVGKVLYSTVVQMKLSREM